ncbi:LamG domain-containing protein [Sinorhizobium fredii]|uniref:LamG domain-containing protein n=1 Tax=Rhizobium fredii TaxID=380 RepID=UPI0005656E7C|nr:LamG domain-containing protein [Sinorhizobium fredii]
MLMNMTTFDVSLHCGFNGVDGATTSTDDSNSAHTLTFVGNAQLDTAQQKFGGSSLLLDGTGDIVTCAASTDWDFGSSPFTIEMFARFNTITSTSRSVLGSSGSNAASFVMGINAGLSNFQFAFSSNGGSSFNEIITSSGVTAATGQWYHLCVDRDGSNKIRLYIDGVMRGSLTTANAINYESTALAIGATDGTGSSDMDGWLDEVRITKGVARYASDSGFTVPTAAYPRS